MEALTNTLEITQGSKVQYAQEMEEGENDFPMYVKELNGDRCIIVTDLGWDELNPTNVVMLEDLILAV